MCTHGDGNNPEDPSPSLGLYKKTSTNRSYDGAEERSETPDTDVEASLFNGHHVRNGSSTASNHGDTRETSQEAESDEHVDVGRKSASSRENNEKGVADVIDVDAAVQLAER